MKTYTTPQLKIISIGNKTDVVTASPANDNLYSDAGGWELTNFGF